MAADGADLIFIRGVVHTPDVIRTGGRAPAPDALAVRGGRITAVGASPELLPLRRRGTEVVDLRGRPLLPGIIDAHCHFAAYGFRQDALDLKAPGMDSIEAIVAAVRERARAAPPGTWIRGYGYDQSKLREGRHPTRWDLDRAAPDHYVVLGRTCGHISAVNSRVLEVLGVGARTPDPPGGKYGRCGELPPGVAPAALDPAEPDGVLYETSQYRLGELLAPTEDDIVEALGAASRAYLALGVTSVHDAGGWGGPQLRALHRARAAGTLGVRVYQMVVGSNDDEAFEEAHFAAGLVTGAGDAWVRIGPFKLFTDGSSSGPTAATREPYTSDPASSGILYMDQETLNRRFARAHAHGFGLTAHAVGDRAVEQVLNAIEHALRSGPGGPPAGRERAGRGERGATGSRGWGGPRPRIEHCAMAPAEHQERIARLGIVPVPQAVFFHEFGDGYLRNYGPERVRTMFPCRDFAGRRIPFALSSDCPVTTPSPWWGMALACTRRTAGGADAACGQTLDLGTALWHYTWGGAYASGEEGLKGTLEVGKLADLCVLAEPLLGRDPDAVRDTVVDLTVVDGAVAYRREG